MKEITNQELLQLQLDILHDVDAFCRKNKIEYFLVGGTGIGAIRHGGYIPWDDDIDIGMTRPNYDRFLSCFNGSYNNLTVYAPELNWNFYAPYANVCDNRTILYEGANGHNGMDIGVKIDIFPYDVVPSNMVSFELLRKKSIEINIQLGSKRRLLHKLNIKDYKLFVYTAFKRMISVNRSYSSLQKELHKLAVNNNWDGGQYLEKIVFPYKHNKVCKREVFEKYYDIKFENLTVRNIESYDEYLTSVFGDYMTLPPIEERVAIHDFYACWKD